MPKKDQHTQWGTTFLVAAELERRDYTVALTLGNTPAIDLMVSTDDGKSFSVDVKGLSSKNSCWPVRKARRKNRFFVLVLFEKVLQCERTNSKDKDRFFVLSEDEANNLVDEYHSKHPKDKGKVKGIPRKSVLSGDFENRWDKLC